MKVVDFLLRAVNDAVKEHFNVAIIDEEFDYGWVGLSLAVLCFPARLLIPHPGPEKHPAAAHGRPAAAGPAAPPGVPRRP